MRKKDTVYLTKVFWDRVKTLLAEQNMTQEELALNIGVNVGTLRGWIARLILPRAHEAVQIAMALHTTVEFLVLEKEGGEYLSKLLAEKPLQLIYPTQILNLLDELKSLPKDQLELINKLVKFISQSNKEVSMHDLYYAYNDIKYSGE